jgi:hypothetical protein
MTNEQWVGRVLCMSIRMITHIMQSAIFMHMFSLRKLLIPIDAITYEAITRKLEP